MRVPVKCPMNLCGDSQGMIIYITNPDYDLNKNHLAILYHKLRECAAYGIFNPIKVCATVNISNILTKSVLEDTLGSFSDESYVLF